MTDREYQNGSEGGTYNYGAGNTESSGQYAEDRTDYRGQYQENDRQRPENWAEWTADMIRWAAGTAADGIDRTADAMRSVSRVVDDAVNGGDYSGLGKNVKQAVYGQGGQAGSRTSRQPEMNINDYFAPEKSDALPRIGALFFGLCMLFWGLMMIVGLVTGIAAGIDGSDIAGVIVCAVFAALNFWGFMREKNKSEQRWRYSRYKSALYPKLYAEVRDLAVKVNKPTDEVKKDLAELTARGEIRQGHFDDTGAYFIASDEIYRSYRQLTQPDREKKAAESSAAARRDSLPPAAKKIIENAKQSADLLLDASSKIKDSEVAADVVTMENVIREIAGEVEKQPSLVSGLTLFSDYYLPTSVKLVNAYVEMDEQPIQGDNIRKSKKEIADALDTINDAYATLLDSFFKEQSVDVTSDIRVMKAMMKQEGLTPDDLSLQREKKENTADAEAARSAGKKQTLVFGGGSAQAVEEEEDS